MSDKICGSISNKIFKGCIVGWLLDPSSTEPRTALIKINGIIHVIKSNQKRFKPVKHVEHVNNGFKLKIDESLYKLLKKDNEVVLIDQLTNFQVYKTVIKLSDEDLCKLKEHVKDSNVRTEILNKSEVINKECFIGKLTSTFSNFKITGWLALKDFSKIKDDGHYRTAVIKLSDGSEFETLANVKRKDLQKKGIPDGKAGFEVRIPTDIVSHLPTSFKASLYDKETNVLIDEINYENIDVFSPENFGEYLKYSMINPVVYRPFKENHKRCFAFMENIASVLEKQDVSCLISVIMPVYNREKIVLESINSVLSQTYKNFELIIVDDASTDNTLQVIESVKDSRVIILKNTVNKGCSYSRNYGVNNSKGKYIFYLDSDNTWDSRYLKVMMGAFKILPKASMIYSGQYLFNGKDQNCYAIRFGSFNRALLENRNYIDLNCIGHTREAFDFVGGFDVNLRRLVDHDFVLRVSKNLAVYSIPVLLSHYYNNKASNTITALESLPKLNTCSIMDEAELPTVDKINVSAIIPNYESIDDLEKCVESLINCGCSEIIVVDNNSSERTVAKLEELEKKQKISLIKNSINYGFSYAVNQGIRISNTSNDILIVNNDSIYARNSLMIMRNAAYSLKDVGLVVPRQMLYSGNPTINTHVPFANKNLDCDVNLSYHHHNIENVPLFSDGKYIELNFAPFFSAYIRRDVYERAGELDAQHGRHYRSDRVYCDVIRYMLGLKIYYVADAVVYHQFQRATSIMKKEDKHSYDLIYVQNKWSEEERHNEGFIEKLWE